jgi:dihydrofolate reductase
MKTTVYIATSLDGFIARKDGNLDWMLNIENPTNEDYGYADFMSTIDAIVMGRGTFEKVLTFSSWPYEQKVFVLSTTRKDAPKNLKGKVSLLSMLPKELLSHLTKEGFSSIYVDGGKTIQNFLREDLIDKLIVTKIPVLIGSGIPLFNDLPRDLSFKHIETKTYPNGLVKSHYIRNRD